MKRLILYIAVVCGFYHLIVVGGLLAFMGFFISPVTHRAISLAFALTLLILKYPLNLGERDRVLYHWIDIGLILISLISLGFLIFFNNEVLNYASYGILDLKGAILAFLLLIALLEGCRRASESLVLPALMVVMVLVTMYSNYMPGILRSSGFSFKELGLMLYVSPNGFFGIPLRVATTVIVMFMIFSQVLGAIGGANWFINLGLCLVGKSKGGPAKAAVIGSAIFGTISGSPSSNAAAIGLITIPLMKSRGYSPAFAGGVEAVASTGGQIMPPVMGAVAFIIAEWIGVPYIEVVSAAFIPALLYFATLLYGVDAEARVKNLMPVQDDEILPLAMVIKQGWFYLVPMAALVYMLVIAQFPPEMSAFYSIVVSLMLGLFIDRQRNCLSVPSFYQAAARMKAMVVSIGEGVQLWVKIGVICAAVGIMVGCLTQSGVGLKIAGSVIKSAHGNLLLVLLMAAVAAYILGMGIDTLPLYLTLAILVAPALTALGVPPIAAHLFVLFWGLTSHLTPPVCLAVYVASTIAQSDVWKTGLQAMRLGIVLFLIPFVFVYYPGIMMRGSAGDIISAIVRTLIANIGFVSGLTGFFIVRRRWTSRILMMIGGVLVMLYSWHYFLTGLIMLFILTFWPFFARSRALQSA